MSRQRSTIIKTSILLGSLCLSLWMIPASINFLRSTVATRLGTHPADVHAGDIAASLAAQRDKNPHDLRIIATSDPEASIEQRIAILEEAIANQPDVPAPKPERD